MKASTEINEAQDLQNEVQKLEEETKTKETKKRSKKDEDENKDIPLMEAIYKIGLELKVPKTNEQTDPVTGKTWQYRNVEDILSALTPIRQKYGVFITFNSFPQTIGSFNYIIVTATAWNTKGEQFSLSSSAREDFDRPRNWAPQISGSCESYAKKYCLQSMFMIDDSALKAVIDPDAQPVIKTAPVNLLPKSTSGFIGDANSNLPLLVRGRGDWMKRMSDAALWPGTKDSFIEKIKAEYQISDSDLSILVAAIQNA